MTDLLGANQFVLWLRANEWEAFEEDRMTSALYLKSELLRFDTAPAGSQEARQSQRSPRLYFSDTDATSLTKALENWMKSTQDESSRILVILDDLDGLDDTHQRTISRMFAARTLDLIYTARDPLLADKGMIWEAKDFEVPPLEDQRAAALLQDLMRDSRSQQRLHRESPDLFRIVAADLVNRLGALPSAITIASHYAKDHFKSVDRLLPDLDNGHILKFRRDGIRYTHTILESFEVSKSRLQRNTRGNEVLYRLSLTVLELFSVLRLASFRRERLEEFCKILGECSGNRSESPLTNDLRILSDDCSLMNRCVTGLIRVSLLSSPNAHGIIKLNILTASCVRLTSKSTGHDEVSMLQDVFAYFQSRADGADLFKTSIGIGHDP